MSSVKITDLRQTRRSTLKVTEGQVETSFRRKVLMLLSPKLFDSKFEMEIKISLVLGDV